MLWATTISDIRSRYAGAVLGMFWLVLYPVLMLTAYSIVYVFILQIRRSRTPRNTDEHQ